MIDPIAISKKIALNIPRKKKNPSVAAHNAAVHVKRQIAERRAHTKRSHKALMQRRGK